MESQKPEQGSLEWMEIGDRLLTIRQIEIKIGLSESTIYKYMGEGGFPRPLKLGNTAVRWRESEIDAWIANLPTAAYREPRPTDTPENRASGRRKRGRPRKIPITRDSATLG